MIKLIKAKNKTELANKAAEIISQTVHNKPDALLGLATGETPLETYGALAQMCKSGKLDFSKIKTVNLDEYAGLDGENPQSYRYYMNKNLFSKINILPQNTHILNGAAKDIEEECRSFDEFIEKSGGIDLQLLGIGVDGHIGFNEPSDEFIKETHKVTLDASTLEANSRFFKSKADVPKAALTMGIGAIMNAEKILLLASGKNKLSALEDALFGEITPMLPASILQKHNDVTVIFCDF